MREFHETDYETEFDYNSQGRRPAQENYTINVLAAMISLIIIGGLLAILYHAFTL